MKRRALLSILVAAAMFPPIKVRARQPGPPVVGVLVIGKPDPTPMLDAFRAALARLGYIDGKNIRLEIRSADGDLARLPALAADLARQRVAVTAAWMTPAVLAAKEATRDIPIVMIGAADPVGMGIVQSLARPGGNITGMAGLTSELAGKLVELLKEAVPGLRRIAVLSNADDPFSTVFLTQTKSAGDRQAIEIVPIPVAADAELPAAFDRIKAEKLGAIIVQPSLPLAQAAELALRFKIPSAAPLGPFAKLGGLMAYSNDPNENYRRAAIYVAKILEGANPADLPVEQPMRFQLIINLKTAKAIGLTVPPSLLIRADNVIE
jgi:putative ABC transport system substrate-binding protein